jgi:hypothetical protein
MVVPLTQVIFFAEVFEAVVVATGVGVADGVADAVGCGVSGFFIEILSAGLE